MPNIVLIEVSLPALNRSLPQRSRLVVKLERAADQDAQAETVSELSVGIGKWNTKRRVRLRFDMPLPEGTSFTDLEATAALLVHTGTDVKTGDFISTVASPVKSSGLATVSISEIT